MKATTTTTVAATEDPKHKKGHYLRRFGYRLFRFSRSVTGILFWMIVIWLFFFEVETIRRAEMFPALVPKEVVMITKWQYGARSPQKFWLPFVRIPFSGVQVRFPGFKAPQVNDVIAYYGHEQGEPEVFLGRIAALPNQKIDSLSMSNLHASKVWKLWQLDRTSPKIVIPPSRLKALDLKIVAQTPAYIRVTGTQEATAALAALPYLQNERALSDANFSFLRAEKWQSVPEDTYLVLPDNRLGQYPVRLVKSSDIIGKAWRLVWSADENFIPQLDRIFRRVR